MDRNAVNNEYRLMQAELVHAERWEVQWLSGIHAVPTTRADIMRCYARHSTVRGEAEITFMYLNF